MANRITLTEIIRHAQSETNATFAQQVSDFFEPQIRERIEKRKNLRDIDAQRLRLTALSELGLILKNLKGISNEFEVNYPSILTKLVDACAWKLALPRQKPIDVVEADTHWQAGILRQMDSFAQMPDSIRLKRLLDKCTQEDKRAIARRTLRTVVAHVAKSTKPVILFALEGQQLEIRWKVCKPFLLQQIDLYAFLFTDEDTAGAFIADAMKNLRHWLYKQLLKEGVDSGEIENAYEQAQMEVYDDLLKKRKKPDDQKSNVGAEASLSTTLIAFVKQSRFVSKFLKKSPEKADSERIEHQAKSDSDDDEPLEEERTALSTIVQDCFKKLSDECQKFLTRLYLDDSSDKINVVARQFGIEPPVFYRKVEKCRKTLEICIREQGTQQQLTFWLR
ncbi:hypothetical protein GCM10028807_53720 [Spirosoma daeguense]